MAMLQASHRPQVRSLAEAMAARVAALIAVVAIVAGAIFRCWNIGTEPFWLDEAYSAYAADHGFWFLWHVVPLYESHPPFYYSLLRLWSLATGDTLLARRLLGVAGGFATVALAGAGAATLARILAAPRAMRASMIAAAVALTALHPLLIAMSRQVRPYPLMTAVYAAATLALLELCAESSGGRRLGRGWIALFFLAEGLMLWLHDLGPFFGCAMSLALIVGVARRDLSKSEWLWLIGAQLVAGVAYLPNLLITLHEATAWVHASWLHFEPAQIPAELGVIYCNWNLAARVAELVAVVIGVALLSRQMRSGRTAGALLVLAVLPTILSIVASMLIGPVFLDRTLSPVAVPALLICVIPFAAAGAWRWIAGVLLAVILIPAIGEDVAAARSGPHQDWYGAIAWLQPRIGRGDTIWAYPNDGALPLDYALGDKHLAMPVRQIPGPMPALGYRGYHPTGTRGVIALYPDDIARLARSQAEKAPARIWLLSLSGELYDPARNMVRDLSFHRPVIAHYRSGRIELIGFGPERQSQGVSTFKRM